MPPGEFRRSDTASSIRSPIGSRVPAGEGHTRRVSGRNQAGVWAERTLPDGTMRGCLEEPTGLLFDHALFNGHPRFSGISPRARADRHVGDFLASALNQNVGLWRRRRSLPEIETQAVHGSRS